MNEQIGKLWNKTCEEIHPEMDGICMTNQRGQKFAELIVRECIAQCEKNAEHEWLGSGSKLSAFNIKEHFGVEE